MRAPDVEAALIAHLTGRGITVRSTLGPPYPALRLFRAGGSRERVADTALIQVECEGAEGASKAIVLGRLEDALSAAVDADGVLAGGVWLSSVQVLQAPAYLPDATTGAPRYVATLTITARSHG